MRGKIALLATLVAAYGLGTPWAVSRLPANVGSTLGEFHHEVNQLARGDFKAVLPTLPTAPSASEPAVAGWADLAMDRMSQQQPVRPLASGPMAPGSGLQSLSLGSMLVGLDEVPRMEAPGAWARDLAGAPDPEPKAVTAASEPSYAVGRSGSREKASSSVSRMAVALAMSAPRIAYEPIIPAEEAVPASAAIAPEGPPKPPIAIEAAPSRNERLALFIPGAPDEATLAAQRAAMTGWARSRGYRVVDYFTSADPGRPQDDIFAAATAGAFSAVAVWTASETRDAAVLDALRARKVAVVTVPESVMPPVLSASVPRDQAQTGSTGLRPGRS